MRLLATVWLFTALVFSNPAMAGDFKNSLYAAWVDETTKEVKIVDQHLDALESEVKRLEKEFQGAKNQIKDDKKCVKLDCAKIEKLAEQIYQSLEATNLSVSMTRIAQEELENLARNQKFAAIAQAKGLQGEMSKMKNALFVLELTQRAAHLTAGITVSYLTGDAQGAAGNAERFLQHTYASLINYSVNQGADLALEHKTALGKLGQDTAGTAKGSFGDSFIGSVSSQIGSVRIVGVGETGKLTKKLGAAVVGKDPKATVSKAVQIVTRAVVNALMEPLVAGKRRHLEEAMVQLDDTFAAQRDLRLAEMFGGVAIGMAQERQRKVSDLADRIKKLATGCKAKFRESECSKQHKQAEKGAKAKREKAVAKLEAENGAAENKLEAKREEWRVAMVEAAEHHQALQRVRDDLLDAQSLAENRSKLEDLATAAPDADKRTQYKAELARLNKLESLEILQAREKETEAARQAAWDKIDALLPAIEKERKAALAVYNKNQDAIDVAYKAYHKEMNAAYEAFLKCLGSKISTLPEAANPSLKELRAKLSQEVDPNIIYFPLQEKLKALAKHASETKITARQKDGKLCGEKQALAPVTDGECWAVHPLFENEAVVQEKGGKVSATIYSGKDYMVYEGTLKGDQLDLEHVYTKADRGFLRNWIGGGVSDAMIDKLISLGPKATVKGTRSKGTPQGYLVNPTPALGQAYQHELANMTHQMLDYDLPPNLTGGFEPVINSEYCDKNYCISKLDDGHRPSHLDLLPEKFFAGEAQWLKLDPIWKHAGYVTALNEGFKESPDGMFALGDKIWIEVTSDMNCKRRQDEITVRVEPEKKPKKGFDVVLKETSKDSGIYRSDGGVKLDFKKKDVIDGFQGNIRLYVPEQQEFSEEGFYPMTIPILKK